VEVTGTVPDVRPYYASAFAAIVPLRIGAGTRLKILESMAARVPVVSTTLGAEGLVIRPDQHILIADDERDWVRHLTLDPKRRAELTDAGYDLVRSRYDWNTIGNELADTYRSWLSFRA
jgi:glycosyltransferase involved in cell wall biosynthesis